MNRGDVILIEFPFVDGTGTKIRPALVVMADAYNRKLSQTIIALISSSKSRFVGDPCQLFVDPDAPEGRQTGLRMPSVVLGETMMTVRQERSLKILGHFSPSLMRLVDDCLKASLGLS